MRRFQLVLILVGCSVVVSQAGCFYYTPYTYFQLQEHHGARERFEFRVDDETFRGELIQSRTLIWFPFVVFIPGHNPYHFALFQKQRENGTGSVTLVELADVQGKVLVSSATDAALLSRNRSDRAGVWTPVFTRNPKWTGWHRRRSSSNGWRYTRPIQLPHGCNKLSLKVKVQGDLLGSTPLRER